MSKYQNRVNGPPLPGSNMMISNVILEYTGESRDRKQTMSHLNYMKSIACQIADAPARLIQQIVDATAKLQNGCFNDMTRADKEISRIQKAASMLALRTQKPSKAKPPTLTVSAVASPQTPGYQRSTSLFCITSEFAAQNDNEVFIRPVPPLRKDFLALASVDRLIRAESLEYLNSKLSFDFRNDIEALQTFCTVIRPEHRQRIRSISLQIIESLAQYDLQLSPNLSSYLNTNVPNLQTLFISFIPRDPTRLDYPTLDWGLQTPERFFGPSGMKAKVVMNMRWEPDCDQFEFEHLGIPGWQCLDAAGWEGLREIL